MMNVDLKCSVSTVHCDMAVSAMRTMRSVENAEMRDFTPSSQSHARNARDSKDVHTHRGCFMKHHARQTFETVSRRARCSRNTGMAHQIFIKMMRHGALKGCGLLTSWRFRPASPAEVDPSPGAAFAGSRRSPDPSPAPRLRRRCGSRGEDRAWEWRRRRGCSNAP